MRKSDPWYIHLVLWVVILILVYVLIRVAYIEPNTVVESEKFNKAESRTRMNNLRQAEMLWEDKHGSYTDNLDSLVYFIKNDSTVMKVIEGTDTITRRSTNPFVALRSKPLTENMDTLEYFTETIPEMLTRTPRSDQQYILQVDTTTSVDTVINQRGKVVKVDTLTEIGTRYYIEDPDGYGSIGDVYSDALKNTASWE